MIQQRWQCVEKMMTADGEPCSAPGGFSSRSRRWEPDPRTAGPALREVEQGLGDTTATVSPPGTTLPAAQGWGHPGGWGSLSPFLVWLFPGILCPGVDAGTAGAPPRWSPSSSLWAHPGGLKELMPKSTQFPNIPTV